MGIHWRPIGYCLGIIQEYCEDNGLAPLQALAVNAKTRIPGPGYYGSARSAF
jgi:hypothetical protein